MLELKYDSLFLCNANTAGHPTLHLAALHAAGKQAATTATNSAAYSTTDIQPECEVTPLGGVCSQADNLCCLEWLLMEGTGKVRGTVGIKGH